MRIIITFTLFMFALIAAHTLNTAKSMDGLPAVKDDINQTEKPETQFVSHILHPSHILSADYIHETHNFFNNQTCQRYLQYIQLSLRINTQFLLKVVIYSIQSRTKVLTELHKYAHTIGHNNQKILYTYIIRHILI